MPDERDNFSEEKPNLRAIGESILKWIPLMLADWNPMPDTAYAKKMGWPVLEDGTIVTPGLGRVPSRELCEEKRIERMLKADDPRDDITELERMHNLEKFPLPTPIVKGEVDGTSEGGGGHTRSVTRQVHPEVSSD